jgi:hypothetical protein
LLAQKRKEWALFAMGHSHNVRPTLKRLFLRGAFAVLGGFGGVGLAWIVLALKTHPKTRSGFGELLAGCGPALAIGGLFGFFASLGMALFLFRDRSPLAQKELEKRFIGDRGLWKIYAGVPMFFVAVLAMLGYETLAKVVGESAAPYISLLVLLVVVGISLYFFERIPRSLILPIGLLGWMLLIGFACWYGWFGSSVMGSH